MNAEQQPSMSEDQQRQSNERETDLKNYSLELQKVTVSLYTELQKALDDFDKQLENATYDGELHDAHAPGIVQDLGEAVKIQMDIRQKIEGLKDLFKTHA